MSGTSPNFGFESLTCSALRRDARDKRLPCAILSGSGLGALSVGEHRRKLLRGLVDQLEPAAQYVHHSPEVLARAERRLAKVRHKLVRSAASDRRQTGVRQAVLRSVSKLSLTFLRFARERHLQGRHGGQKRGSWFSKTQREFNCGQGTRKIETNACSNGTLGIFAASATAPARTALGVRPVAAARRV